MLLYVGLSTWRVQNYLRAVALLLFSSPLEWGGWWRFFNSVHLHFCLFLLSLYGAVSPRLLLVL